MLFAQMFHIVNGNMQQACGGESCIRIDGRYGREMQDKQAKRHIRMLALNIRHFDGYQILRGSDWATAKPITDVILYRAGEE